MAKYIPTIRRCFRSVFLGLISMLLPFNQVQSQAYNDGPIQLKAKLRRFNLTFAETDITIFGAVGSPDDMTYKLWFRDFPDIDTVSLNGGWGLGSGCLIEPYAQPFTDFNLELFNHTYTSTPAPQYLELRTDFWEDESPDQISGIACTGTRCNYEVNFCCGAIIFGNCSGIIDSDDLPCNSSLNPGGAPYASLDYRLGPPGQWYSHDSVPGICANNVYLPTIETFWRYTGGENCATAIDLGTLQPGFSPISHFNAVDYYVDDIVYAGGGRDVVYKVTVAQTVGLTATTCGTGSLLSDLLILDASCSIIASNSGACGNGSSITRAMCVPGVYYIVVEARGNGLGNFTLSLTEQTALSLIANAGPDTIACPALPIQIGVPFPTPYATGGSSPYTFNWSPSTGLSSPAVVNPIASNASSQAYVLTVVDQTGCTDTDTMQFTVLGTAFSLGADTSLCPGSNLQLNAPAGASSYAWSTGATSPSITVSTAGAYSVTVQAASGCQLADTLVLSYIPANPPNLGTDTILCADTSFTLSGGSGYASYAWSTGSTNPSIVVSTGGSYSLTVTEASGCSSSDTMFVNGLVDCVFPGDVNYDLGVDMLDVLSLGTVIGNSGPPRPLASLNWYGQAAPDWISSFPLVNHKQVDTDGNGLLTQDDTLAIQQNWGRTHTRITGVSSTGLNLRFEPVSSTVYSGNLVAYEVWLEGDGGTQVDSVHGLSFIVTWNPAGMALNALREADFSACWFTGTGNHMDFTRLGTNTAELGVSRTNGIDASGQGLAGTLYFATLAGLPNGQPFNFQPTISQPRIISATQALRSPLVVVNPVLVTDSTSRVTYAMQDKNLPYPNPAHTEIQVPLDAQQALLVELVNPLGQLVRKVNATGLSRLSLRTADLPEGIYLLRIQYAAHVVSHSVQVQH